MLLALVLLCCIVRCHPTRHAWVDAFEVGNAVTSLLPPVLFFVLQAATGGISGPVFNGYAPNGTMLLNFSGLDQAMAVATSVFPGVEVNSYGGLSIEGVASNADLTAVSKAVSSHLEAKGWPTLYESIGDEPQGESIVPLQVKYGYWTLVRRSSGVRL